MSSYKNRLSRLERHAGTVSDASRVELMKPSEIVKRCDELAQAGASLTDEQRARLKTLRQVIR